MKIAVIGSHGIGKTYFSKNLYAHLLKMGRNVTLIAELSRSCPLPMHEKTTKSAQAWVLFNQIVKEIEAAKDFDIVICDRGVMDNYAYFVRAHGESRDLDDVIRYWLSSYDLIYKIQNTSKYLVDDGFRSTNEKWQMEMDARIKKILDDFKINYVELESGSWQTAVGEIEKGIEREHAEMESEAAVAKI